MAIVESLIGLGGSLLGGLWKNNSEKKLQEQNIAMQREFAQNGIRWKVADAKAAGVHPLFALGANTQSFTNVAGGGDGMGDAIASAGQNLGRAAQAAMSAGEREKAAAADALTLEKAGLENELLRTQISQLKNPPGQPPAMPDLNKNAPPGIAGPMTLLGQGDAKRAVDMPHGFRVTPRANESSANKLEDEYGEVADVVGAYRLLKDSGIALGDMGNVLRERIYRWQESRRPNAAHVPLRYDRERGTRWYGSYGR